MTTSTTSDATAVAQELLSRPSAKRPRTRPATTPATMSDLEYIVIARATECAICTKPRPNAADQIVPATYFGRAEDPADYWAVHSRCGALRHRILGSSPKPANAEGLARVLRLRPAAFRLLRRAAMAHLLEDYDSVEAITELERAFDGLVGWDIKSREKPGAISAADWEWLQTSAAFEAIWDAAYGLLKADG